MTSNRSIYKLSVFFLTLSLIFVSTGCSQKKKIKGSEFIQRETLVEILTEIYLIDGITNDIKYYRKYIPGDSIDIYGSIFKAHGVDKAQYELTISEYSKYPELLNAVYDEVLMELNMMQDAIDKEENIDEAPRGEFDPD